MDCDATPLGTDCRISTYRDVMDIMGNQRTGHFNGYKKERLGWLESGSGTIATAAASGAFTLESYAASVGAHPKALKILKEVDPETGDRTWFYVEYRQALGFDSFLAENPNVLGGLTVRVATETEFPSSTSSLLLDMTPGSDSYDDMQDPALPFGSSFHDPASGVTLIGHRGSAETAIVEVSYGSRSCIAAAPTVEVLPAESQWAEPGTPVTYTIAATNNDSADCLAETFQVNAAAPSGWQAIVEPASVTLDPAANDSFGLTVTSPADAPDGNVMIDIVLTRSDGTGSPASASATYVVSAASSNTPPVAIDDGAQTNQGVPVSIDVLANDSDPDFDALAVTSVSLPSRGVVTFTTDGVVVYSPKKGAKGEDSFEYSVSDGAAQSTARVVVLIQGNSGSGGGKGNGKKK
jgi:hypothetical protein